MAATHSRDETPDLRSEAPLVGIVVLHWNNYRATNRLLEGLRRIRYPSYRLYVVDNGSTDGSRERLESEWTHDNTLFVCNGANLGFSAGVNRGISQAIKDDVEYVLLINNDCVVINAGFIEPLIALAENSPTVGLVSGKIVQWPRVDKLWSAGGFMSWRGARYLGLGEDDKGQHDSATIRGFLSGAFLLIRREVIRMVGLLPEAYFFGHEDWEYSVRVAKSGFRLFYEPRSIIAHEAGSSHNAVEPVHLYNDALSRILFKKRNSSASSYAVWWICYAVYVVLFLPFARLLRPRHFLSGTSIRTLRRASLAALRDSFRVTSITLDTLEAFRRRADVNQL